MFAYFIARWMQNLTMLIPMWNPHWKRFFFVEAKRLSKWGFRTNLTLGVIWHPQFNFFCPGTLKQHPLLAISYKLLIILIINIPLSGLVWNGTGIKSVSLSKSDPLTCVLKIRQSLKEFHWNFISPLPVSQSSFNCFSKREDCWTFF